MSYVSFRARIGAEDKGAVAEFAGRKAAAADVFIQKGASNTGKGARFDGSDGNRFRFLIHINLPRFDELMIRSV